MCLPVGRKSFSATTLWRVFVLGVLVNLAYLAALSLHPVSRANLYPSSKETPTVWQGADVGTYVKPARSFLATGVFARIAGLPDYHRTVGYPFFLAVCMVLGGDNWVELVMIVQAVLFASIYPALAIVARAVFAASPRQTAWVLAGYALSGAGWAYTPILLTDQSFTVCLWWAVALGLLALKRGGGRLWAGHFILLGIAASVRPTLAVFPFGFAALTIGVQPWGARRRPGFSLLAVFLVQMALCQAPALRNYVHHRVWIPTDVMVNNLSDYLAKDVAAAAGGIDSYRQAKDRWDPLALADKLAAKTEFARDTFAAHPLITLRVASTNLLLNTVETHWINLLHMFRTSLHCDLKRWSVLSPPLKAYHASWAVINGSLALAAGFGLSRIARRRQWALLAFAVVFSLPFLYGATDAQGARFRLYLEGLILMLAFCPPVPRDRECHSEQREPGGPMAGVP